MGVLLFVTAFFLFLCFFRILLAALDAAPGCHGLEDSTLLPPCHAPGELLFLFTLPRRSW
jgi:hypothetical protein